MKKSVIISTMTLTLILLFGVFAFGTYDARNELAVLTPNVVKATSEGSLEIPSLSTNKLEVSNLTSGNSKLDTSDLEVTELDKLELEVQTIDVPKLDATELDKPETVTSELDVTKLDTPKLDVAELDVSELDVTEFDVSELDYKFCYLTAADFTIFTGGDVELSWQTGGFDTVTLDGVEVDPSGSIRFENVLQNTTYRLVAETDDGNSSCVKTVTVNCVPPPATPTCELLPAFQTIQEGERATLSWSTDNANSATLTGFGAVALNASNQLTDPLFVDTTFILTASSNGKSTQCESVVYVEEEELIPACDSFLATPNVIEKGESATLSWETTNASTVTINFGLGSVEVDGSAVVSPIADITYTLTAFGENNAKDQCQVTIIVEDETDTIPQCVSFVGDKTSLPVGGGNVSLNWNVTDATNVSISPTIGTVNSVGSTSINVVADTIFTLTASDADGDEDSCKVAIDVDETVNTTPQCVDFKAEHTSLPFGGGSTVLTWSTLNADQVVISPLLGTVSKNGTGTVAITNDTTFTLTATDNDGEEDDCQVTITVEDETDTIPQCVSFVADKTSLPVGGGNISLNWNVTDATNISISPTIGTVNSVGSTSINVVADTIFTLTAKDADGDEDSCTVAIDVADVTPTPISCSANVNFTSSRTSIDEGDEVTLTWSTSGGINSIAINNGISSTALSGNESIRLDNNTTFTLTASDGTDTISCPLSIDVDTGGGGGGGGGSSSPRCDLEVSDTNIRRGEDVELRWDTSRASEVTLFDDHGDVYIDTDEFLSSDKREFYDGEITVSPSRDTKYTLRAERGSRDRECTVRVNVDDDITVLQSRDQQPLVAGISLTQVPYTGFEAGPILTTIFYLLLAAWALYVTYVLVIRRESLAGFHLGPNTLQSESSERAGNIGVNDENNHSHSAKEVAPVVASTVAAPSNLPTLQATTGYAEFKDPVAVERSAVTKLEDQAHEKRVLMSSDAISHFMNTFDDEATQNEKLDAIIKEATSQYPTEDGWLVLNKERMVVLCSKITLTVTYEKDHSPVSVPTGSGSLAEAIVTGNVVGAYGLIGNRPMVALADAATDLDNVLRKKQGELVAISQLLDEVTEQIDIAKIKVAISALTGALDGTYTSEEEAVKMSIMKAIRALS